MAESSDRNLPLPPTRSNLDMSDIEALILETAAIMEPLISKPKMADKHLRKPPFGYLHDIVVALVETHQFPRCLSVADLDRANFTERVSFFHFLRFLSCKMLDYMQYIIYTINVASVCLFIILILHNSCVMQ